MDTPESPGAREGGLRASVSLVRRSREFRRVYFASLISLGGDWFLTVALFSLVLRLTDSGIAVALVIGVHDLAFFIASPVAGILTDRWDRRRLMVAADLARAVLCLGFLLVQTASQVWLVYALLAAMAVFSAVFEPASVAALPNLVEPEDLVTANALAGSSWGTMLAVGAAIGGVVTAVFGAGTAVVIDALSFAASAAMIAPIRRSFSEPGTQAREHPGIGAATVETARYARKDHRVLALLAVKFGWGVAGGVLVLIPLLAKGPFHAGDVAVGMLMAARGVGALIGPFAGRASLGQGDRRLFSTIGVALVVFGTGYALVGLAPGLLLALPALTLAHLGGGAQWTLSSYGLQKIVPDHIRGRIFAFDGMLVTLTFGTSSVLTGWLAETYGPGPTAIGLGCIAIAWAAVWTLLTTGVRRATLIEGCGMAPELAAAAVPPGS